MITVTEAYLTGITEARRELKNSPDMDAGEIQQRLDNCRVAIPQFSGVIKEMYKGERDFWRRQLTLAANKEAS